MSRCSYITSSRCKGEAAPHGHAHRLQWVRLQDPAHSEMGTGIWKHQAPWVHSVISFTSLISSSLCHFLIPRPVPQKDDWASWPKQHCDEAVCRWTPIKQVSQVLAENCGASHLANLQVPQGVPPSSRKTSCHFHCSSTVHTDRRPEEMHFMDVNEKLYSNSLVSHFLEVSWGQQSHSI